MSSNGMSNPLGILWAEPQEALGVLPKFPNTPKTPHITLAWGVTEAKYAEVLGLTTSVHFQDECWNNQIQAVRCVLQPGIPFEHEIPHCTISWVDGGKPLESTAMLQRDHSSESLDLIVPCEIQWVELKDSVGAYRQKILGLMTSGQSLNKACAELKLPPSTARGWFTRLPSEHQDLVQYQKLVKGNKSRLGGWKLGRSRNS